MWYMHRTGNLTTCISKEGIAVAGEKVLVYLYCGKPDDGLDILWHKSFCEKVATMNIYKYLNMHSTFFPHHLQ